MKEQHPVVVTEMEGAQDRHESTITRVARSTSKLAAKAAIFGALGLAGGIALSTIVPTEVPLGPGTGRATVTLDGKATIDGGLLGSARKEVDSPSIGPVDLGIRIRTNEIPNLNTTDTNSVEKTESFTQIFEDFDEKNVQKYGELYRRTSAQSGEITDALRAQTLKLSLVVGSICVSLYALPGKKGRREILHSLRSNKALFLLLPIMAAANYAALPQGTDHQWARVNAEFDNTPLEGVEISGVAMTELINNYGQKVMRYIRQTDEFYNGALQNANEELAKHTLLGQRPQDAENSVFLFFTDNHGNTGTPKIMAQTADTAGVRLAVDGGDTVPSGTPYEVYFVEQQQDAFNDQGIQVVTAPGNHDSSVTSDAMKENGAIVLSGEPVTEQGITFLGDADPRSSEIGQGIQLRGGKTLAELGDSLSDAACSTDEALVVVAHDKHVAQAVIESGCADFTLSGHTHNYEILSTRRPDGTLTNRLTGGSAGGVKQNTITYGPLQNPSEFMLVSVNNGQLMSRQRFSVSTGGKLTVGPIIDTQSN